MVSSLSLFLFLRVTSTLIQLSHLLLSFSRSSYFNNWAFNLRRGWQAVDLWKKIPAGVDILMTHGPPLGRGDLSTGGYRTGCLDLVKISLFLLVDLRIRVFSPPT